MSDRLRAKLHAWELQHLRDHVEELRLQLDEALRRAQYAEDLAERWRDDALQAIEDAGRVPGLTLSGAIVSLEPTENRT